MDPGLCEDGPCPSSGCLEGPLACESSVESPATGAKPRKSSSDQKPGRRADPIIKYIVLFPLLDNPVTWLSLALFYIWEREGPGELSNLSWIVQLDEVVPFANTKAMIPDPLASQGRTLGLILAKSAVRFHKGNALYFYVRGKQNKKPPTFSPYLDWQSMISLLLERVGSHATRANGGFYPESVLKSVCCLHFVFQVCDTTLHYLSN